MKAIDATRKPLTTIGGDRPLRAAAEVMDRAAVGALVVTGDGGELLGVLTDRDVVVRGLARGNTDGRCDSVMSTDVVTADADGDLRDVIQVFGRHAVRRVVLLRDGRPAGLLSVDDLVVDLVADLSTVVAPVTAEVLFGHPQPAPLATT